MPSFISKSKYLAGLQCPKLLWYHYNSPGDIPEPDEATQAVFDTGHLVGDLAKRLYPGGEEVPMGDSLSETVSRTQALLPQRKPIFEASFLADGCYCRVDVLVPAAGDAWDLIEVKSATSVKPVNIDDVAFQAHCLGRAGVSLNRLHLMHLDNRYVKQGEIDPGGLLHAEDVTSGAGEKKPEVARTVEGLLGAIAGPEPEVPIGPHCNAPYGCDLQYICWSFLPEHNVTQLYRAGARKKFELISRGVTALTDAPTGKLTDRQRIQQRAVENGRPYVEANSIRAWLSGLRFPLYCLDFETMAPAIPLVDGTRPYQQVPFQFSLHVLDAFDSTPRHHEYLAAQPADPRPGLIEALRVIGPKGTVLAYNVGFERGVINRLAEDFPGHRAFLEDLSARLKDLMTPFSSFWCYHPDQKGSCSLKEVLPAFTGKSYEDMAIHDGSQAAREFQRAVFGGAPAAQREKVLKDLRAYCEQDTIAMLDILEALRRMG